MAAYWEIAAQSAYDMFSKYKYQFSFSHLGFWSGNFCLSAPFLHHCLLPTCTFYNNISYKLLHLPEERKPRKWRNHNQCLR